MNKKIIYFLSTCCIFSSTMLTTPVIATETSNNSIQQIQIIPIPSIVDPVSYSYQQVIIGQAYSNYKFVGYHPQTVNWTTASSYTTSSSFTVSTTVSGGSKIGFSGSLTTTLTTTVGAVIPANALKYSKIGIYADYDIKTYRIDKVDDSSGRVISSSTIVVTKPTNVYQTAVYQ